MSTIANNSSVPYVDMYNLLQILGFELSSHNNYFHGTLAEGDLELWVGMRNGFSCGVQSKNGHFSKPIIDNYRITKASEVSSLLSRIDYIKEHFPRLYRKILIVETYNFFRKLGFETDPFEKRSTSFWWGTQSLEDGSTLWIKCQSGFLLPDCRTATFFADRDYKGMQDTVLSPIEFENVNELLELLLKIPFFKRETPNLYQAIYQYHSESV